MFYHKSLRSALVLKVVVKHLKEAVRENVPKHLGVVWIHSEDWWGRTNKKDMRSGSGWTDHCFLPITQLVPYFIFHLSFLEKDDSIFNNWNRCHLPKPLHFAPKLFMTIWEASPHYVTLSPSEHHFSPQYAFSDWNISPIPISKQSSTMSALFTNKNRFLFNGKFSLAVLHHNLLRNSTL